MQIAITATPEEIAALVVAIQERTALKAAKMDAGANDRYSATTMPDDPTAKKGQGPLQAPIFDENITIRDIIAGSSRLDRQEFRA